MNTPGEEILYSLLRDNIQVIFDVGSRDQSLFIDFPGEVHYFEPVEKHLSNLKKQPNKNSKAFFNQFGLSDEEATLLYYPRYESFYNRIESCQIDDTSNKMDLVVKVAKDYCKEQNIQSIGFLKIDTEGYEYKVLKGFGDYLSIIKYVQFEYGGTYIDSKVKLIEVVELLKKYGFTNFYYIQHDDWQTQFLTPITDFTDHYRYCNIFVTRDN